MKSALLSLAAALLLAVPAMAATARDTTATTISGDYAEFRTADVYTGPCFANGEVGLTGDEAVLAWHVTTGTWEGVRLDGLSVLAVVRASATLGNPYSNPLPARAVMIVDARATAEQRAALVRFAQAQAGPLLSTVVATESSPIRFELGPQHGVVAVQANTVRISTRAIVSTDDICHNEDVFYPPLVEHLTHAMPAMTLQGSYSGNHLGKTWNDAGRRGAFVGQFAA
ncbi:MAG TPA: DUF1326 domain-containing protein [Candidatus Acidoferrales bacterium]|nr:DUF1326 domain-containing protein [Candidatus Acidoferrales bacterium]